MNIRNKKNYSQRTISFKKKYFSSYTYVLKAKVLYDDSSFIFNTTLSLSAHLYSEKNYDKDFLFARIQDILLKQGFERLN